MSYLNIIPGFLKICSEVSELFIKLLFCVNEPNAIRFFNTSSTEYRLKLLRFGINEGNWLCPYSKLSDGMHIHTDKCKAYYNYCKNSCISELKRTQHLYGTIGLSSQHLVLDINVCINRFSAAHEYIELYFNLKPLDKLDENIFLFCDVKFYNLESKYFHPFTSICDIEPKRIIYPNCWNPHSLHNCRCYSCNWNDWLLIVPF